MLENIRAHSYVVARVAEALIKGFDGREAQRLDLSLIHAGALLHDIAKTQCIVEECNHALVGKEICLTNGYPEIGEIVAEHVILHSFSVDNYLQGVFSAKDIIYYADKRVRHDHIVSLEERLEYIIERYGNNDEKRHLLIKQNFSKCLELEKHLYNFMTFLPHELPLYVSSAPF